MRAPIFRCYNVRWYCARLRSRKKHTKYDCVPSSFTQLVNVVFLKNSCIFVAFFFPLCYHKIPVRLISIYPYLYYTTTYLIRWNHYMVFILGDFIARYTSETKRFSLPFISFSRAYSRSCASDGLAQDTWYTIFQNHFHRGSFHRSSQYNACRYVLSGRITIGELIHFRDPVTVCEIN